jgi:hypothetical protein
MCPLERPETLSPCILNGITGSPAVIRVHAVGLSAVTVTNDPV